MTRTIFMIHGMWGGPWYWENYRQVLEAEGYRCIAATLPYHDMDPRGIPDMLHLLPENERMEVYEKCVYESGRATFEIGFWLFDPRAASRVDASRVNCPVLVVAGAEDRITPAAVVRKVARKYRAVSTYKEF